MNGRSEQDTAVGQIDEARTFLRHGIAAHWRRYADFRGQDSFSSSDVTCSIVRTKAASSCELAACWRA